MAESTAAMKITLDRPWYMRLVALRFGRRLYLGPRIGRFDGPWAPAGYSCHSTVLACLGGLILWVGFYAFNGGSEQGIAGKDFNSNTVGLVITTRPLLGP